MLVGSRIGEEQGVRRVPAALRPNVLLRRLVPLSQHFEHKVSQLFFGLAPGGFLVREQLGQQRPSFAPQLSGPRMVSACHSDVSAMPSFN